MTTHQAPRTDSREGDALSRGRRPSEPVVLLALLVIALVISGMNPRHRRTWFLETAPVVVGVAAMVATYRKFPWTPLAYRLAFGLSLLLIIGGHYEFARVPLGLEVKRVLGLRRNDYDRVVHFFGGFVPAILGRELLLRATPLRRGRWLAFLVAWSCLAGAALYELLEWAAAVVEGQKTGDFLAMQGDRWDTQWDMLTTFVGAIVSLLLLTRLHDRQLGRLGPGTAAGGR
jgi:putative membrane protein